MHRPGIASVRGNHIILDGTTIDEAEKYHLDTLKLAVHASNADRPAMAEREKVQRDRAAEAREAQVQAAREAASRLKFD